MLRMEQSRAELEYSVELDGTQNYMGIECRDREESALRVLSGILGFLGSNELH